MCQFCAFSCLFRCLQEPFQNSYAVVSLYVSLFLQSDCLSFFAIFFSKCMRNDTFPSCFDFFLALWLSRAASFLTRDLISLEITRFRDFPLSRGGGEMRGLLTHTHPPLESSSRDRYQYFGTLPTTFKCLIFHLSNWPLATFSNYSRAASSCHYQNLDVFLNLVWSLIFASDLSPWRINSCHGQKRAYTQPWDQKRNPPFLPSSLFLSLIRKWCDECENVFRTPNHAGYCVLSWPWFTTSFQNFNFEVVFG